MAGGKLSPRQKMVNLMYLVFIAMLALNMSKEVLKAFGRMNEKFEDVNKFSEEYNTSLFSTLETKASENPAQFGTPFARAKKVQQISKELYTYLGTLKSDVTKEFERQKDGQLPYEQMDKGSYIDESWFEGDGYSPKGKEIMAKLEDYKKQIAAVFGVDVKYKIIIQTLNKKFNFENVKDDEGISNKYLAYHFQLFPAIASIAKLTSIQNDVKSVEQDIYNALIGNTTAQTASMKNYKAIVIMDKSLFFQGETVTGRVVLGRYDETTVPTSVSVGGASISMENGQAVFKLSAGAVGDHDIKGKFTFKEDEKLIPIDIEGKYAVVPKPNKATVSSDNMQIIYQEVDNPMSISFSGIQSNNVTASAVGLTKDGNDGKYKWNVGKFKEKTISVTVNAKLPDGKMISDKQSFKVRPVPKPALTIGGDSGLSIGKAADLFDAPLGIEFGTFGQGYKISGLVTSVTLSVAGKPYSIPGEPGKVSISSDPKAVAALKALPKGATVYVTATYKQNNGAIKNDAYACTFKIN
jgi:gliding motility-associated protein GldM